MSATPAAATTSGSSSYEAFVAAKVRKHEVDQNFSIKFYYRSANNLLKQASIYRDENNVLDLFTSLLRFTSLVTDTIPSHQDYHLYHQLKMEYRKELLRIWTHEEARRRHRAEKVREIEYNAYVDLQEKMQKVGCRANKSGAPHINIITREPIEVPEAPAVPPTYLDDVKKYKDVQRTLLLRERMSGACNFNILNWKASSPGLESPPWPEKPPTPPPRPPPPPDAPIINSSKGALSCCGFLGPFGGVNIS